MADTSDLPQWGGIFEPMTVLTNVLLAIVAFVFAVRLGIHSAVEGSVSGSFLAGALLATAGAAVLGAVAHGLDPVGERELRGRFWRGALYTTGGIGALTMASVAYFSASGSVRIAILAVAGLKFIRFIVRVVRRPEFRVAAADYGGALAVLFAAAVYAAFRWRLASAPWLIGGVVISLVAGVAQARRLGLSRHFNHNDVYHVIQLVALYAIYRGGMILVDR